MYLPLSALADNQLFVIAREDDYFLGVLHSTVHESWARSQGTQVREVESGFRYTPNSTFDTFPFPWPPGSEPTGSEDLRDFAIAEAARTLVQLRNAWLNPPDTPESDLKKRTLTNLYNQRAAGKCSWLDNAHRALDEAVFAAYGWPYPLPTRRSSPASSPSTTKARRLPPHPDPLASPQCVRTWSNFLQGYKSEYEAKVSALKTLHTFAGGWGVL